MNNNEDNDCQDMFIDSSLSHDHRAMDSDQYYEKIILFLQEKDLNGEDKLPAKNWIKTQAANYYLNNGELFYGKRKPRRVVVEKTAQNEILSEIHIDPETGFHVGVKKMHQTLQKTYFWRYSYESITNYIYNCSTCKSTDTAPTTSLKSRINVFPWKEIELHCFGPIEPSNNNREYLAIIYDPVSRWISAESVGKKAEMAEFLFENFCNYGATLCYAFGVDGTEFNDLKQRFCKLTDLADPVIEVDNLKHAKECSIDPKLHDKIASYVKVSGANWANRMNLINWIWNLRNESADGISALKVMFDDKYSPIFQKQSTKVLGKRNQQKSGPFIDHLSDKRLTRSANSSNKTLSHSFNQIEPLPVSVESHQTDGPGSTSTAVAAVKALIAETKEKKSRRDRQKRGEYRRYTPEIREAIIQHAIRHGTHDAARAFTSSLGFAVSYSSVRNFVLAYNAFSPQLKEEIGRYAAQCGIDATQKLYATKLSKPLSVALIRKFRRMYLRITTGNQTTSQGVSHRKGAPVVRHLFCASIREEIGKYAAQHGVAAAVRYFTDKLQFSVKESTVRKFKKIFAPPASSSSSSSVQPPPPLPPTPPAPVQVIQPETNYYQQYNYSNQYVYQQPLNGYHSNQQVYSVPQPVPPYPMYTTLPPPPQYQPMSTSSVQLPAYSRNWNEDCHEVNLPLEPAIAIADPEPALAPAPAPPSIILPPLELNPANSSLLNSNNPVKKKKTASKSSRRGNYATYSPEFRLEVGRYAADHGCQEAAQHFKDKIGHEIPESTLRGLRDKFLSHKNSSDKETSSLNSCPRGRPYRLGQHDQAVQECIRELKRSGEQVNTFVAIATARQVLLQREPSLLTEFGGPITLTTNWGKSFLKRMGINKQHAQGDNCASTSQSSNT